LGATFRAAGKVVPDADHNTKGSSGTIAVFWPAILGASNQHRTLSATTGRSEERRFHHLYGFRQQFCVKLGWMSRRCFYDHRGFRVERIAFVQLWCIIHPASKLI
jgi:hypothetical protein